MVPRGYRFSRLPSVDAGSSRLGLMKLTNETPNDGIWTVFFWQDEPDYEDAW
jgi:hypothetical protein